MHSVCLQVLKIAKSHNCSAAVVLLAWAIQHGFAVVPRSVDEGRLADNLSIVQTTGSSSGGVTLTVDEMEMLDTMGKEQAESRGPARFCWDPTTML